MLLSPLGPGIANFDQVQDIAGRWGQVQSYFDDLLPEDDPITSCLLDFIACCRSISGYHKASSIASAQRSTNRAVMRLSRLIQLAREQDRELRLPH
jgi:hypothetical protein